jgi:DNA polymerase-3 subunit delta
MSKPLHAIDFLGPAGAKTAVPAVVAVFGDEPFLVRLVLAALKDRVLGSGDADFSLSTFDGDSADWRSVADELSTMAMFGGGRRLVVVEDADDFVSRNRPQLEDYVAAPRATGALVLAVKTWSSTTRLAKAVAEGGLAIECKAPSEARLVKWLITRAKEAHRGTLEPAAAETLIELVGPQLGLLDQQLARLAVSVGAGEPITADLVSDTVGGWRTKTAWEMLDAAASGDAPAALEQLDRLITSGDQPIALLAQMASTLRRFATATRLVEQAERAGRRASLRPALEQAGFKSFVLNKAESQLRQLGRHRAGQLYNWLLEADLALKGTSSSPPKARLVLEKLIARMSRTTGQRVG